MHIQDEKEHVRQRIKERAARLTPNDRNAESRSMCRRIVENLPEGNLTICAYVPMPSEADIKPLLEELLEQGHHVFLPRFTRSHFEFRQVTSLDDLIPGKFNLPEPLASAPMLENKNVSVALIPGVGFDTHGHRLGRGNGGYDRWLQELRNVNPKALVWGIALAHQIVDTVPTETHDQRVDAIMTAREMILCR